MKPRPTNAQPGDRPVPPKFRIMQQGILQFQPTAADKVKIAMGYGIKVKITQRMVHNPGPIDVHADWEVTEFAATKDTPTIPNHEQAPAAETPEKGAKP